VLICVLVHFGEFCILDSDFGSPSYSANGEYDYIWANELCAKSSQSRYRFLAVGSHFRTPSYFARSTSGFHFFTLPFPPYPALETSPFPTQFGVMRPIMKSQCFQAEAVEQDTY
jgi:hypothetical protein